MEIGWIALTVLLLLLLFAALGALWAYRVAFFVPKRREEPIYALPDGEQYRARRDAMLSLIREMAELPYESVSIRARDGTTLRGRLYRARPGAPLQIQFHGYRGSAVRDFCGGNKLAREAGFHTLVVDQRAHGASGGRTITFGIRERFDCLDWIEFANRTFGAETPITLAGVSMGAATVLMAAGLPLPENVKGILADCPYSSPKAILVKVCRDRHIPPALGYPLLRLGARLYGHFDPNAASPVEAVRAARVPILLLHGEDDRFVPAAMSAEIERACASPVRRRTFPEAGHGISYLVDPEGYKAAVSDFLASLP